MLYAALVYTGTEPEAVFGPFTTEQDADDWCRNNGIELADAREDEQPRALLIPLNPPD